MSRRWALLVGAVTAAVVGLGVAQLVPGGAPVAQASGLVTYDSCAELLQHYRAELGRAVTAYGGGYGGPVIAVPDAATSAEGGGTDGARASSPGSAGSGPTGTNLQEQGVDEPDLAKLADGRLVVLAGTRLRVLSAEPQPRLLGTLDLSTEPGYGGGELLLVGDRALVVLPGWREVRASPASGAAARATWSPGTPTTRVVLADLAGGDPRLVEDATYDGQYVSARLVEGSVRLVTATYPQLPFGYPTEPGPAAEREAVARNRALVARAELADVLPQVVRRDAAGTVLERGTAVACDRTAYAPEARGAGTLMVTTMRPGERGLVATDRTAVTTDGDLVYASAERLYVATSRWGTVPPMTAVDMRGVVSTDGVRTQLHAFDTSSPTTTTYVGSGDVAGYVYGRWALSEYDGVLRVATTRQPPWTAEGAWGETSSMVVKLAERDGKLVETGRISGLGRTEQIRAVRYFGELAAVVTFRQTDPLYLLDLGDEPRMLGELKIPGFATYLHPLGAGLLLGVGQDATARGEVTGMQVSVFDISDPSSPRQVDRLSLGPGWSPALDDSRAFSYDPPRRMVTFPFTSYTNIGGESSDALGIAVGRDGTLREVGRLDLGPQAWAARVFFSGDLVLAVSDTGVVAGDVATMTRTGSVSFGQPPEIPVPGE